MGIRAAGLVFVLFPVMSVLVRMPGGAPFVWLAVAAQLALTLLVNMCYGSIFIFITAASPSRHTLGATNGLAQMTVSFMRAVGPSLANSLFSLSLVLEFERGLGMVAGGWVVYYAMLVLVAAALVGGSCLPKEVWKRADEAGR